MPQLIRLSLYPVSIILIIWGVVSSNYFIISLGAALLIFSMFFFSGRKQRVRYWLQGYITNLEVTSDVNNAIEKTKLEFCGSKYATGDICDKTYTSIDELVLDIIKVEYKFKLLLQHNGSSEGMIKSVKDYTKAVNKLKKEIENVTGEKL